MLLEVRNLTVGFQHKNEFYKVIDNLSFSIKQGEILGIVGESGSGKSMTALSIMGLLAKDAMIAKGEMIFDQIGDLCQLSSTKLRQLKGQEIAMIFQEPMTSLNPVLTVGKQIDEMVRLHDDALQEDIYHKTIQIMQEVGLQDADKLYHKYPHQLSGGMRQRVMIAMAMVLKPKLLIADEPTTALDVTIQAQILKLLKYLNQEYGVSVILISHDLGVIKSICQNAIVMFEGRILEAGHVHQLFYHPKEEYTKKLLSAVPRREKTGQFLEAKQVQKKVSDHTEIVLSVKNLTTYYKDQGNSFWKRKKGRKILDQVSLEIQKGEIFGIVGESGCGKSTLAKAIMGLVTEIEGEINLKGYTARMVFQDPYSSLNPAKKVSWILEEPLKIQKKYSKEERKEKVYEMIQKVGLKEKHLDRYISQLSGGQRQRISIASALIVKPEIIILDEPVSALDVTIQAQILSLLLELREVFQLSYLFISHDLNVMYQMCDKIGVMYQGRMIEEATGKELYGNPKQTYTKKLMQSIPDL